MMTSPPTLGMILKGYPRISETFISNEILLLEQQGIPVRIFSMRYPRESFTHASVQRIRARVDYLPTELLPDFSRLFMPTALLAVREPSRFLAALALAGRRFRRNRSLATIKHLLQAGYLVQRLLRHAPEVVHLHAHFAHSPTSVALFASLMSGLPFSFTAHAKDIYTANQEQLREKIRLASLVVTCTEYNRQYLQRVAGNGATPVHCVYHGIDLGLFSGPGQRPAPRPPYRILTVARLTAKKGIPTILAALARLRDRGIDFRYTLIGDGDDRDRVMDRIFALGLQERCRWPGVLPHEQVIGAFARADLFALGCTVAGNGDRDGIPNVLVESLAMGLPAVATRVSALPEIVHDNATGLLVPPDDPAAMADAMNRLLTDERLRHRAMHQGRELVAARFDNRNLIKRLASIYCNAIPALGC